jgi:hypothetical protein
VLPGFANPDITVDASKQDALECARTILDRLVVGGFI